MKSFEIPAAGKTGTEKMDCPASLICPLCGAEDSVLFCERNNSALATRYYFRCPVCVLIFLLPQQRFDLAQEKRHYDFHRNKPSDTRYLNFLRRLAEPLSVRLNASASGLDFGCGLGPAMSSLFREKSFKMGDYDPIYFPQTALLEGTYDFVTCSETAEHFYNPAVEFQLLDRLLKPGGYLGIMTGIPEDENAFKTWWYAGDPTHVCFYQRKTFEWIAQWRNWNLELPSPNIVIFQKLKTSISPVILE